MEVRPSEDCESKVGSVEVGVAEVGAAVDGAPGLRRSKAGAAELDWTSPQPRRSRISDVRRRSVGKMHSDSGEVRPKQS